MKVTPLNKFTLIPMNTEESEILMNLLMSEMRSPEADPELVQLMEADSMCQLINKRANYHGFSTTPELTLMIANTSDGIPGRAVQLLHAVRMNTPADTQKLTVNHFCQAFASGLPAHQSFTQAWDEQKDGGANRIDNPANWTRKQ